ncbi:zinc transporter ZntB [Thetidibacter halocola]|uniref:Zinc transporter ZntB n=1 Tax=Thetidibacter halocola TaxID=2827239 RepID=A0A8J7WBQ9_9RHOB|nr:zinc transporter ZntB [Thetidibacter halocola]MBS0123837.1 zinc transporter ZntB [Thetidibacter halocola]
MTDPAPHPESLLAYAHVLDGPAAGTALTADEAPAVLRADTLAWVHLRAQHPDTAGWIMQNLSYLDPTIVDALVAEETRPRVTRVGDGLIVILRGINTNEGADPEDMVSVRLWIDPHRIVSLSRRRVSAIELLSDALAQGRGPTDAAGFLVRLTQSLNTRIESFWSELEDEADALEEEVLTGATSDGMRQRLVELRRRAIILRRYLQPQRDAMRMLQAIHPHWLMQDGLRELAEELDALERVVEDADALRDRMALVRDELVSQMSQRLNRNMYLLSILSALFLPLTFLTGLFGINVDGLPGADHPAAFWIFSAALAVLVAVQMVVLRRLRWI